MTELKIFQNPDFGNVRTLEENGRVLFCGKDIATILGYKNARDAIRKHCRKDGVAKRDGVSQTENQHGTVTNQITKITFIDEGNLYRLITHSRLPSAEKFERWVFDEVLPSIRKSGVYGDMGDIVRQCVREVLKQVMPLIGESRGKLMTPAERMTDALLIQSRKVRQHYKVEGVPDEILAEMIEKRLRDGATYVELSEWLEQQGIRISRSAVHRYFAGMKVQDVYSDRIELVSFKNEIITVFSDGSIVRRICG